MCALLRYSAGGLAAILTTAYISVSAETGMSAFRSTVIEPASPQRTIVNRLNKGDREALAPVTSVTAHTRPASVSKEPKILEGCDPAFSPLTAAAKHNYASRCLS